MRLTFFQEARQAEERASLGHEEDSEAAEHGSSDEGAHCAKPALTLVSLPRDYSEDKADEHVCPGDSVGVISDTGNDVAGTHYSVCRLVAKTFL